MLNRILVPILMIATSWQTWLFSIAVIALLVHKKCFPPINDSRYFTVLGSISFQILLVIFGVYQYWFRTGLVDDPGWKINAAFLMAIVASIFILLQPFVFSGYRLVFVFVAVVQLLWLILELFICLMAIKNEWL
jgi:hypothetical protein